jgi:predicted house-cleaning noncanonical NTP pyrophosphatase (MazG superfamily)
MKKTVSQLLSEIDSVYVPVRNNCRDIIRISGHPPAPNRLKNGEYTKNCKNVYLIFVKSLIDETWEDDAELAELIQLIESNDPEEKKHGDICLNNWIVEIGNKANKGMNYLIIDGNSEYEIDATVEKVKKMLKTSAFIPLEYI